MADVYNKSKRSEIMSHVRSRNTSAENEVAGLLRKLKVRVKRNVSSMPGRPDFVVSSAKTVIFVHGCFWHNHRNCKRATLPKTNRKFWKRKIEGNRRRDANVARLLRKEGWHVVTVWQCTLRSKDRVRNRLRRILGDKS